MRVSCRDQRIDRTWHQFDRLFERGDGLLCIVLLQARVAKEKIPEAEIWVDLQRLAGRVLSLGIAANLDQLTGLVGVGTDKTWLNRADTVKQLDGLFMLLELNVSLGKLVKQSRGFRKQQRQTLPLGHYA
ncbi:MAG: hypothetical protein P8X66_14760, partial [Maritimibacter sp.]